MMYMKRTNPTKSLCVCFACRLFLFSFFFVNATTTKTANFNECFESFTSILSTFQNLWIWMSRRMTQTYFELDAKVILKLIAINVVVSTNDLDIPKISWVLMSTEKNDSLLLSGSQVKSVYFRSQEYKNKNLFPLFSCCLNLKTKSIYGKICFNFFYFFFLNSECKLIWHSTDCLGYKGNTNK